MILIKVLVLFLTLLSIYLLFAKNGEMGRGELLYTFMTIFIFVISYINYNTIGTEAYFQKALIGMVALCPIIGNVLKKKSYTFARIFMNIGLLMNVYFLFFGDVLK